MLAPVLGIAFGILLWGDELTMRMAIGGVTTLVGVLVIALRQKGMVDTGT